MSTHFEIVGDDDEQEQKQTRDYSRGSSFIPGLVLHGRGADHLAADYRPFDRDGRWRTLPPWLRAEILEHPQMTLPDGAEPGEDLRGRIKKRLLGEMNELAPVFDPTAPEAQRRPYVPGLMNHNTTPALVAPKAWGKTWMLCPFAATLIVPGKRFLEFFPPAEMTEEERLRDVWFFNSETPIGDVHEILLASGLRFGYREGRLPIYYADETGPGSGALIVDHLNLGGGPSSFDLTDPVKFEMWVTRLIEYGDRELPPLTMIADGVTAMLRNDTSGYGAWVSRFNDLKRLVQIPNAIGSLHSPMGVNTNTPMGGVESLGEWDGAWICSSPKLPIEYPDTARYFRVSPRALGPTQPKRRVRLDRATLALRLDGQPIDDGPIEREPEQTGDALRVAEWVLAHPGALGSEVDDALSVDYTARAAAAELGLVSSTPCGSGCAVCPPGTNLRGRHRSRHFYAVEVSPPSE